MSTKQVLAKPAYTKTLSIYIAIDLSSPYSSLYSGMTMIHAVLAGILQHTVVGEHYYLVVQA